MTQGQTLKNTVERMFGDALRHCLSAKERKS